MTEEDSIELTKWIISSESVRRMSKSQKRQYLMITTMRRDSILLLKLLLLIRNNEGFDEPSQSANESISSFLLKILISKCHEMWVFMKNEGFLEMNLDGESDSFRNTIVDFFAIERNKEIFSFIRNKFGFHYESASHHKEELENLIEPEMNSQEMDMWLSTDSLNEIFGSSDAVISKVILHKMRAIGFNGTNEELMMQLFVSTLKIYDFLNQFYLKYLVNIVLKDVQHEDYGTVKVVAPLLSKVKLPVIVKLDRKNA